MAWDTEETRRRLKEAAVAEFGDRGPDATMADIANRAGITTAGGPAPGAPGGSRRCARRTRRCSPGRPAARRPRPRAAVYSASKGALGSSDQKRHPDAVARRIPHLAKKSPARYRTPGSLLH